MKINLNRFFAGILTVCFMIPQTGFAVKAETANEDFLSAENTVSETIPKISEETETSEESEEDVNSVVSLVPETKYEDEPKAENALNEPNAALSNREAVEADLAEITEGSILVGGLGDG